MIQLSYCTTTERFSTQKPRVCCRAAYVSLHYHHFHCRSFGPVAMSLIATVAFGIDMNNKGTYEEFNKMGERLQANQSGFRIVLSILSSTYIGGLSCYFFKVQFFFLLHCICNILSIHFQFLHQNLQRVWLSCWTLTW